MKPIVIAGNGPSLAQIDYSRLPQDFDVYRCNQFYFEDKYYLGKKIKGAFFNQSILKEQYWTIQKIRENGEYEIDDIYSRYLMCHADRKKDRVRFEGARDILKYDFPDVKDSYIFLEQLQDIHAILKNYLNFYQVNFTSGISMLITAVAQGYKEIYLVGIDFYLSKEVYAFDMGKAKNLYSRMPHFSGQLKRHTASASFDRENLDVKIIEYIAQNYDVDIFSLVPNSPLSQICPIAPVIHYCPPP